MAATIPGMTCVECGAALPENGTCQTSFHELLALEWRIPGGPGALNHFFAVASYNLQHPSAFTPEARSGLRKGLELGLSGDAGVPSMRHDARQVFDGSARVLRVRGVAPGDGSGWHVEGWPAHWPLTVLDVCMSPADRAAYGERVRAWAEVVTATLREPGMAPKR